MRRSVQGFEGIPTELPRKHHSRFSAARTVEQQVPPLDVVETPDWLCETLDLACFELANLRACLLSLSLVELGHVSFLLSVILNELPVLPLEGYTSNGLVNRAIFRYTEVAITQSSQFVQP
jgi:hypothetical protein